MTDTYFCGRCGNQIFGNPMMIALPNGNKECVCEDCAQMLKYSSYRDVVKYIGRYNVAKKVEMFLKELGWDLTSPDLKETPYRIARVFEEYSLALTKEAEERIKFIFSRRFPSTYDEMVIFKDITAHSLCPHHCLPVHMKISIGYIPIKWVIGLSKITEFVELISKQPILQEELTKIIAERIRKELKPKGVGVIIKATHDCMSIRDVKQSIPIITSCLLGVMRSKAETRAEFLKLT